MVPEGTKINSINMYVRIPDYIAAREVSELGSDTWALARMSLVAHHLYIDSYSIDLIQHPSH